MEERGRVRKGDVRGKIREGGERELWREGEGESLRKRARGDHSSRGTCNVHPEPFPSSLASLPVLPSFSLLTFFPQSILKKYLFMMLLPLVISSPIPLHVQ